MKFWDAHADARDRFTMVAIHDRRAKDFAEMDAKLVERGILEKWGGRNLPFPVLLDAKGETVTAWGIWGFPTTVLIDPEGRLQSGGLTELAKALAIPDGGAEGGPESR